MKRILSLLFVIGTLFTICGCAGYQRGTAVPPELRTIHIPAFENSTEYPMVGAIAAQQFMDVLIEDGNFTPESYENARLRTQVIISNCQTSSVRYDRNNVIIPSEYYLTISAKLYVYDAVTGEPYIDGKTVTATDTMLTRDQYQTAVVDVFPRVSRRLAKALLDELHSIR